MRELNTVAEQTSIETVISEISKTYDSSTPVVGWYHHPAEVRGPYNRWLTVSEVSPEHEKDVGSRADDARYAAAAMNYAPKLVQEIENLKSSLRMMELNRQSLYQDSLKLVDEINVLRNTVGHWQIKNEALQWDKVQAEIDDLRRSNEILRSKHSQYEKTLIETMKVRDEFKIRSEIFKTAIEEVLKEVGTSTLSNKICAKALADAGF